MSVLQLLKLVTDACSGKKECEFIPNELFGTKGCESAMIEAVCSEPAFSVDTLSLLAMLYIGFVALAMGCAFPIGDFGIVFRTKFKGVVIGFVSQFFFMPLMSYVTARALNLNSNYAIGLVLAGMAPGGSTSNLFTFLVGGNVALSIAMSFLSTVCEIFMLPILWVVYIQSTFTDKEAEIPVLDIVITCLLILIPVVLGAVIRAANPYRNRCGCSARHKACICCCDRRSRSTLPTLKDSATLTATAERFAFGKVKLTAPEKSVPGCVVEFVSPYGTPCTAHVPWGVQPGDQFIAPITDPNDPLNKDCCFCFVWQWLSKLAGPIAVFFLAAAVYVGVRDNPFLFEPEPLILKIHVIALFFQPLGCLFGFALGFLFWLSERYIPCCRCACGGKNAQRLDCKDLRAISLGSGSSCVLPCWCFWVAALCCTHACILLCYCRDWRAELGPDDPNRDACLPRLPTRRSFGFCFSCQSILRFSLRLDCDFPTLLLHGFL